MKLFIKHIKKNLIELLTIMFFIYKTKKKKEKKKKRKKEKEKPDQ